MATSIANAVGGAKGQRELEARVRILQALAEQLPQLLEPIADGLRVDLERVGDRLHLPGPVEPGAQRALEPFARSGGERVERRQPRAREVGGDRGRGGEQQRGQVLVGDDEPPGGLDTRSRRKPGRAGRPRPGRPIGPRRASARCRRRRPVLAPRRCRRRRARLSARARRPRRAGTPPGRGAGSRPLPATARPGRPPPRPPARPRAPCAGRAPRGRASSRPRARRPPRPRRPGPGGGRVAPRSRRRAPRSAPPPRARRRGPRAGRPRPPRPRRAGAAAPSPRPGRRCARNRVTPRAPGPAAAAAAAGGAGSRPRPRTAPRRTRPPTRPRSRRCRRTSPRPGRRALPTGCRLAWPRRRSAARPAARRRGRRRAGRRACGRGDTRRRRAGGRSRPRRRATRGPRAGRGSG